MPPYISQSHGTKKTVYQGMNQNIAIRMGHKGAMIGNTDTTED
jgi:hypothetical protein